MSCKSLTSPDSRCRVSDPAKQSFSVEVTDVAVRGMIGDDDGELVVEVDVDDDGDVTVDDDGDVTGDVTGDEAPEVLNLAL